MSQESILIRPVSGQPDTFQFTFTSKDGKITGQVSVAFEGRPDTRKNDEKMRAARIKLGHLTDAFAAAVRESRYANS